MLSTTARRAGCTGVRLRTRGSELVEIHLAGTVYRRPSRYDRWLARRHLLERKLQGWCTTSELPALIDPVFDRSLVSSDMIVDGLGAAGGVILAIPLSASSREHSIA
jgi:hypothetical protein